MFGILLVGLVGLVVVAVVAPMVLWALCMETLRQREMVSEAGPARFSVPRTVSGISPIASRAAA
jgi:hypothetical protein